MTKFDWMAARAMYLGMPSGSEEEEVLWLASKLAEFRHKLSM